MHRVRVDDHFRICYEAIGCTYSEKKSIKHKNTKGGDFVSCTVYRYFHYSTGHREPCPVLPSKSKTTLMLFNL